MALNIPALVTLAILYALLLLLGLYAAWKRRQVRGEQQSKVMLVARRDFGWVLGTLTMIATWIGGGFINGTAEEIYSPNHGFAQTIPPLVMPIGIILNGIFVAKKMRSAEYTTMLDPLQYKLGKKMGALLYLPALSGEIFYASSILAALGGTISVMIGFDFIASVIGSACIVAVYTLLGGLYSVVYTDVAQLFFMYFGLFLGLPFAFTNSAVNSISETAYHLKDNATGWLGEWKYEATGQWIDIALILIFGTMVWQEYYQRVLASKTPNAARYMSFAAGLGYIIVAIPPILFGAIATSTDWNQTSYGLPSPAERNETSFILPIVFNALTPKPVAVIGLAAVSTAIMSSIDSTTLSASSMFTENVYCQAIRPKAGDIEKTWVLRICLVLFVAVCCAVAITVKSVYGLFLLCNDFVYVLLFPQFYLVMFTDVNTYGAVPAFVIGLILRLGGGDHYFKMNPFIHYPGGSNFPFRTFSMLISALTMVLISYTARFLFANKYINAKYDYFDCRLASGGRTRFKEESATVYQNKSALGTEDDETKI